MNVIVVCEHRFDRTPDGHVWTQTMYSSATWERYLEVFDEVTVVARVRHVDTVPADWTRADGPRIRFDDVPYYLGPVQYLSNLRAIRSATSRSLDQKAAVLLRVPSQVASAMLPALKRSKRPFSVEVIGDPWDVFAPGANTHPLRSAFRVWYRHQMSRLVTAASAVSYVTSGALQQRYPSASGGKSTHYSDVELRSEDFVATGRTFDRILNPTRLITIATLAQMYKRVDVLLNAVALVNTRGGNVDLEIVGDGKHRAELTELAGQLGLQNRVHFAGQITAGKMVRDRLDQSDVFVLPSRQEGLPRALVEAMARGLPCIGTRVGGIPELIGDDMLVEPDNPEALAQKIDDLCRHPETMTRLSAENLATAKEFEESLLAQRRQEFYRWTRSITEAWYGNHDR